MAFQVTEMIRSWSVNLGTVICATVFILAHIFYFRYNQNYEETLSIARKQNDCRCLRRASEYTNLDPTIWRLVFFLLMLPGGLPGPIIYILMWIIVPKAPKA